MNFWQGMNKREKIVSAGGALLLLLLLIYLLGVQPLRRELVKMQKAIPAKKEALAWMENGARTARELTEKRSSVAAASSPLKTIALVAKQYGLSTKLRRVDPGENDEIKVWFEDLVFIDLLKFVRELHEKHGVEVVSFSAERLDEPGVVNARLILKAART